MNQGHLPGSRVVSNLIRLTIQAYKLLISEGKCALSALLCHLVLFVYQPLPENEEKLIESPENTSQIETT